MSVTMVNTSKGIDWLVARLRRDQSPDGSWNYPFETGFSTDAYMIILLRTLEINDEELINLLAQRIISRQEKSGAWKLFYDEQEGNLTATIESYYALLYSGYFDKKDKRLQAAKKFIIANRGLEEASMFTKVMLSLTGQLQWPSSSPLPIEIILLPLNFPINFYSVSVFGRANLTPLMILADKKLSIKTKNSPDLSDLHGRGEQSDDWIRSAEMRSLLSFIKSGVKDLMGLPERLQKLALQRAEKYMLDHIEEDGTFYSYYSSTFLMIFAFLSLGYKNSDPVILNAIKGIRSMKTEIDGLPHMQYTTANVWNTSLIGYALQEAGVSLGDEMVAKANQYLLDKQHAKFGDWVVHNPASLPGGWEFSAVNTINPDVDDTTASLRSIARTHSSIHDSWNRGINWLLSMQNDDGGWAAFEKNTDTKLFELLPIEKAEFILTDPSCADITGRTLEFFANYTNLPKDHHSMKNGVKWLVDHQEIDGSWYGRWGICYIYGTWGALTGLGAAGVPVTDSSVNKAINWLKEIQNSDGGWGESCYSDSNGKYTPLKTSTLTHTAWAVDGLISVSAEPTSEIHKGITYLLNNLQTEDWTTDYPKGQGMAGAFYIHYHSYRYIFPLLTLAHYRRKFER